jgi:hypothetical protein
LHGGPRPSTGTLCAGGHAEPWRCLRSVRPHCHARRFRRLYPDAALHVESLRFQAARASLLAVFAAHALLAAFALKLKASAALRQPDKGARQPGAAGVVPGVYGGVPSDAYTRAQRVSQSQADFFCGIVPGSVLSQLGRAMNLEGAAGVAMRRLSREGLAWVPTAGNVCTLLAFAIALHLNDYLTGVGRCVCVSE